MITMTISDYCCRRYITSQSFLKIEFHELEHDSNALNDFWFNLRRTMSNEYLIIILKLLFQFVPDNFLSVA